MYDLLDPCLAALWVDTSSNTGRLKIILQVLVSVILLNISYFKVLIRTLKLINLFLLNSIVVETLHSSTEEIGSRSA